MCLHVLAATSVVAWAISLQFVLAGQSLVRYVASPRLGNFLIAAGKNLPEGNAYLTLNLNESTYVKVSTVVACLEIFSIIITFSDTVFYLGGF